MRFSILLLSFVFITSNVLANNGVYVSSNTRMAKQQRNAKIEELVEKMVINTILADTGEIVTDFLKKQNINVFPQVAYNGIQMIAMQVFQQESLKSFPQDAYKNAIDKVDELKEQGASTSKMQEAVKNEIDEVLKPLREEYVYQEVIKIAIQEAMKQNQRIIMMAYAQKQSQLVALKQRQVYMQQMMQQYYQQAISQAMNQRIQQAQAQRVRAVQNAQAQYQQVQQEYYRQQQILQNQYEQEMRRRAILEQQQLRR